MPSRLSLRLPCDEKFGLHPDFIAAYMEQDAFHARVRYLSLFKHAEGRDITYVSIIRAQSLMRDGV